MALDGILLYKILPGIAAVLPARIQKIYQISHTEVLFILHGGGERQQLLISCHSQYNRILLTRRSYPTPDEPGNFVMVLRKYLEGSSFEHVEQAGLDRWCTFTIRRRNELGDIEHVRLVAELMGKYANLILVGADGRIIDAMKRIPPFENNRRTIQPGAAFVPTPGQDKRNPFQDPVIHPGQPLTDQFAGFSPFLAREVEYRLARGQSFAAILQEIQDSDQLYIQAHADNPQFHCIALTSLGPCLQMPLFEGFDSIYYHKEEKERIRQISGDLYKTVRRQLKHEQQKLPRLLKEYDEAKDCQKWRVYGDLLYAWHITDTKGRHSIVLQSFETGEEVTVPLDPRLDGNQNAQKCYTRYSKLKKGQVYLQEQIRICQNEIQYLEGLLEQLDLADFATAMEIRSELIRGGYLKDDPHGHRRKKKNEEPHITVISAPDGTQIAFGRNNLQNELLTWHKAAKSDLWMHAKDYHGSHVVIHAREASEQTMRLAANIAAYFSQGRSSSSVPVNWCHVNQLKKIPGAKPGMVQLTSYRTIYIDPDPEELRALGISVD